MTREEQHSRHDAMREYKAQGHTAQDVADKFGVSLQTVRRACVGIAIEYGRRIRAEKASVTLLNKNAESIEERAKGVVERYAPSFEYAGGYTDHNGYVDIRCKVCGYVMRRTCVALRHNSPKCENCKRVEAERRREECERINAERAENERQRRIAEVEAGRRRKEEERLKKHEERLHDCPVCGKRTDRPKYCSKECANRAANTANEMRRRAKVSAVMVDKDITLAALFKRDGGVCHICGGRCSYEDYTTRQGQKISGDWYPSIDHVVPLAKGGEHSWQNVKLAHRRCNYIKSDMLPIQ